MNAPLRRSAASNSSLGTGEIEQRTTTGTHARGEGLARPLAILMAITAGVVVANLYYNQPLLVEMGRSFKATPRQIGLVPTLTQIGYATGILFLVPLADAVNRRLLILSMAAAATVSLVLMATAKNFPFLVFASFAVGVCSIVPQLLVPFAAYLSRPEERGKSVGFVMSGLLIGILLARTVAGEVGSALGWRGMFWVASALGAAMAMTLWRALPHVESAAEASYGELMKSLLQLVRDEPVLRESAIVGGLLFASFSTFWATLTFLLSGAPFHFGPRAPGLFGLVGVAGAIAAPVAGRFADKVDPRQSVRVAVAVAALSFVVFYFFGTSLLGLVIGVILLDAAVQGGHISNQTRIYSLTDEAHNRLNTVYMVTYFVGGAIGSALGTYAWQRQGWAAVSVVGFGFMLIAGLILARRSRPELLIRRQ